MQSELTQSRPYEGYANRTSRLIRRWRDSLWQALTLPMFAFIGIPIAAIFLGLTPETIWRSLQTPQAIQAIRLSALTSFITVSVSVILGTPVAICSTANAPVFNICWIH